MQGGEGALPKGALAQLRPLPQDFFLNLAVSAQDPGSALHLHNLLLGDGRSCRLYFTEEKPEAVKGRLGAQLERLVTQFAAPAYSAPAEPPGLQDFSASST